MVNCALLFELELNSMDRMTRPELINAARERWDCLPVNLRVSLEHVATDHLRLLVVTGRLIHALQQILGRQPLKP